MAANKGGVKVILKIRTGKITARPFGVGVSRLTQLISP